MSNPYSRCQEQIPPEVAEAVLELPRFIVGPDEARRIFATNPDMLKAVLERDQKIRVLLAYLRHPNFG